MMNSKTIDPVEDSDIKLVNASLDGNREAFSQIVGRYQTLICSLAYSATGSVSQSEDLAQDTFVTAWRNLSGLREPGKLRPWLCGILRNRVYKIIRAKVHEPIQVADPLDAAHQLPSRELSPSDQAISREEESILWRSLEKIPEIYRDPLVLYYREHQSIEAVAANLDLSTDAVKQRLSRGRKLLQEEVLSFVEGALERTNPGRMFTLGVLAALPALTISTAKAATIGTAAKGGVAVKGAGVMGALSVVFAPLLIVFGSYASYRQAMDEAQTNQERGNIKKTFRDSLLITLGLSAACAIPLSFALRTQVGPLLFSCLLLSLAVVFYFLTIAVLVIRSLPHRRRRLAQVLADKYNGHFPKAALEYCSHWHLLGWPLLHVRMGDRFDIVRPPVKAWIAIGGSHSIGLIFAWGGVAVAPVSVGGIAIGVLPLGAIAAGLIPVGAMVLGGWAYGGLAFGWQVTCASGFGWDAAAGSIAMAHNFAVGYIVHAAQANTEIARQFIQRSLFFQFSAIVQRHSVLLMLLWVLPLCLQARLVARARRQWEREIA